MRGWHNHLVVGRRAASACAAWWWALCCRTVGLSRQRCGLLEARHVASELAHPGMVLPMSKCPPHAHASCVCVSLAPYRRNHRGLRHYWGLTVRGQHTKVRNWMAGLDGAELCAAAAAATCCLACSWHGCHGMAHAALHRALLPCLRGATWRCIHAAIAPPLCDCRPLAAAARPWAVSVACLPCALLQLRRRWRNVAACLHLRGDLDSWNGALLRLPSQCCLA